MTAGLVTHALVAGYAGRAIVSGIELAVAPGEVVALVGANGAGKSTLLMAISGLLPVMSGQILLDGATIEHRPPHGRVAAGLVHIPEGRQIFGGLTVAENLRLGAYADRTARSAPVLEARIKAVCERFPVLLERLQEPVGNLSGGQQQMLAIARGLMTRPRILLLDEPSLGLAPMLVAEMFRMIAGLRAQGLGILLAEQNARQALAVADRGHVIDLGRVVLSGTGADLLASPDVASRYLGVGNGVVADSAERRRELAARLRAIIGEVPAGL